MKKYAWVFQTLLTHQVYFDSRKVPGVLLDFIKLAITFFSPLKNGSNFESLKVPRAFQTPLTESGNIFNSLTYVAPLRYQFL